MILKFKLFLSFLVLVLIDQLTKFLTVTQVLNQGISFGWHQGISQWWLVLLLVLVLLIFKFSSVNRSVFFQLMVAFFLAGAIGNLIDRFFFGGVRDWLTWSSFNFSNNLADIWITLGFSGIIYEELKLLFKKNKKVTDHDNKT
ncbi:MAG: signal peptidase II [Candidatus Pacebacteria bacterium]|nr:signal peptidase II [Candidatus Paceibacterota bacterium]